VELPVLLVLGKGSIPLLTLGLAHGSAFDLLDLRVTLEM